ncbi:MAG: radical SAM protein [Syntrophorhabdales bacterium]|jgi:histone acetyltransferase (RNA polymerase elongator complex component)
MIVPVFLPHIGCGERCIYCNQDIITNNPGDMRVETRIAQSLASVEGPVEAALYGGNILGLGSTDLAGLLGLFEPYRHKISRMRISAKPGPVSARTIAVLKEHGVRVIELGIPTVNDAILRLLGRGHTARDFFDTFKVLVDEGFELGMQVMVGLPGETFADLQETVCAMITLAPCFVRIYPLVVIEDTRLFERFMKGAYSPDSLDTAVAKACFVYVSAWSHGIRTIKMGLTENEVIKEKIASGPYHPAFGYLVKSEAFYLAVLRVCEEMEARGNVAVSLSASDVPHLIGNRCTNLDRLREKGISIEWTADPALSKGFFRVRGKGKKAEGSLVDGLAMIPS